MKGSVKGLCKSLVYFHKWAERSHNHLPNKSINDFLQKKFEILLNPFLYLFIFSFRYSKYKG